MRRRGRGFQNSAGASPFILAFHPYTNFPATGGNDSTVIAEPTYDRVESSHVKDDTRAARCKSWLIHSSLQMIRYNIRAQLLKDGSS